MDRITFSMLVKCAERELGPRQTVYPRRVAGGKMSLQKVRDEIECMRRIVEILKEMETERSRKFENCLPDSISAVGVGKTSLLRHQRPHHDHIVPTPRLLIFGGEQAKHLVSFTSEPPFAWIGRIVSAS